MDGFYLQILVSVAVPAFFAWVGYIAVFLIFRDRAVARSAFVGVLIAAAYTVAFALTFGGLPFPPREAAHWLPLLAWFGVLVGLLAETRHRVARHFALALTALLVPFVTLRSQWLIKWPPGWPDPLTYLASAAVIYALAWVLDSLVAEREPGLDGALALAMATGFSGVAIAQQASASLGQLTGAFGVTLTGLILIYFLAPVLRLGAGPIYVYSAVMGGTLVGAGAYSDLSWLAIAFLFVSPVAVLPLRGKADFVLHRLLRLLLAALAVGVLIGAAFFIIALTGSHPAASE